MTIYFGMVRSTNDNGWKTCKMSKVYVRSHEITNKPCMSSYYKGTIMLRINLEINEPWTLRSGPQMLKKVKNRHKQNFQCEAYNKQLDKEDTRQSNLNGKCVFNILILLFVFIMFNKHIVKYDFILRYEAWVNAIRASSFIENVPQISPKPIVSQRNLLGKLPRNQPIFTNHFSAKLASKIPAKFPQNRPFFPRIWCPWKSRKIWLFFPRPTRSPVLYKLFTRMRWCRSA